MQDHTVWPQASSSPSPGLGFLYCVGLGGLEGESVGKWPSHSVRWGDGLGRADIGSVYLVPRVTCQEDEKMAVAKALAQV